MVIKSIFFVDLSTWEEYIEDKDYTSSYQHITSVKSENASRKHHQRHQTKSYSTPAKEIECESLSYSTRNKLAMDHVENKKKEFNRHSRKKRLCLPSERSMDDSQASEVKEQNESDGENSYALNNVCNNSNGGVNDMPCWDEVRKSICPEEPIVAPSAAFIEHDIISKQRKEILLLMDELCTRDQELNDLVRSHQSQVKAWEVDRNKLKELQQRLCSYEEELQRSDNCLQATLDETKKVTEQKEIDSMELKKTKEEMEMLSKKIQKNSFYLKQLEVQNRNLLDSVKKLVSDKEDLEIRSKDLSSRLKSNAGELSLQASEITRLRAQNKTLESKLSDANESIRNSKVESSAWKKRYCSAKDEADRLTNDNNTKDENIQNVTMQLHESLQQTLALQKALFTSCEREKCKEEIMNSLRKQQKRTMHEMSALRKLYQRQTKDMTLYHLSVQPNSHSDGGGQTGGHFEMKGGTDELMRTGGLHGQNEQEEGRALGMNQDNSKKVSNYKGDHNEEEQNDDKNDKNMSFHEHKPNFLKYTSKNSSSSFLVKTKIGTSDEEESDSYDERKDFIISVQSDMERSGPGGPSEQKHTVVSKGKNTKGKDESLEMNKKEMDERDGEEFDMAKFRSRNLSRQELQAVNRRSKSLGCGKNNSLNNIILHRHYSCSRGTSPIHIQDRATSPITNFDTAHENSTSLYSDLNALSDDTGSVCKNIKTEQAEKISGEPNEASKTAKEVSDKMSRVIVWPRLRKHNETSGVYLSSSDCSSSSSSSPRQEKIFDELTPADSDGMCNELQRKYIPVEHLLPRSHNKGLDHRKGSIHLRNEPVVIPAHKIDTSTGFSNHDGDSSFTHKRSVFLGGTYRLVDNRQNEDSMIKKEKWNKSSDTHSSIGATYVRSDRMKGEAASHASQNRGNKMDLSSVQNDSLSPIKALGDMNILPISNFVEKESGTAGSNNNKHGNDSQDNKESNSARGNSFSSKDLTDAELHYLQSGHSSQFNPGEGRRNFLLERSDRQKEIARLSNQIDRRVGSSGRCVRTMSSFKEVPSRNMQHNIWRKDKTTGANNGSNSLPSDSDLSDMSLVSTTVKSNTSSLNEKLGRIAATRSWAVKSADNSKASEQSPQRRGETESKYIEVNKGDSEDSSVNTTGNYFYEENVSLDSENIRLRKNIRTGKNKMGQDAFIVPVSSSTCSQPFTSTTAPSLYKHLSRIHFSDKTRRYEWDTPGSSQISEDEEKNQGHPHHERKTPVLSFAINEPTSREEGCKGNYSCNNSNDSSIEHLHKDNNNMILDEFFEDLDCAIFGLQSPNTNMDKFHHHYNNIVRKLSFSNILVNTDYKYEDSVIAHQNHIPPIPVAPEKVIKVNKRSDRYKANSDESIFSPSQIRAIVCDSENNSVVDENVVRKLDFSDSVCVDQSNLETETVYNSHFPNIFGINSEDECVLDPEMKELTKMNIPVDCPEINKYFYPYSLEKHVHCTDNEINYLNDTREANSKCNISQGSKNDHGETGCDKDKIVPLEAESCELSGSDFAPKTSIRNLDKGNKENFDIVTSLPDYFPDISSVMADDDSVRIDDVGGTTGFKDFNNSIIKTQFDADASLCNDRNITTKSMDKQPYSHTSTPTRLKTVSTATKHYSTNDLDSPYPDKHRYDQLEEKTLTSKEASEHLSVGEEGVECVSSEVDDGGDRLKEKNEHVLKSTAQNETNRQIVDSNSIVISFKEKYDMKKHIDSAHDDAGYQSLGRSSERLERNPEFSHKKHFISEDKTDKHRIISCLSKDRAIVTIQSKLTSPEVDCDRDERRPKDNDSSYLEGPWDRFDDRLSNFLADTPQHEISEDLSVASSSVPMSPASKLHLLLLESQEMIRSLEKRVPTLTLQE